MIKKRTRPTTTVREQLLDAEEQSQGEGKEDEDLLYVHIPSFRETFESCNIVFAV